MANNKFGSHRNKTLAAVSALAVATLSLKASSQQKVSLLRQWMIMMTTVKHLLGSHLLFLKS